MIPAFLDSRQERNPLSYNGLTFNQIIGGSKKDIIEVNQVRVRTPVRHIRERREYDTGLEVYGAFKEGKQLNLSGVIRASSHGALYDRIAEMAAAFDPDAVSRDNPDTFGFLPLDFSLPTSNTTDYPSGLIPCRYYVRAEEAFEPPMSQYSGLAVPYVLSLLAADPRRYLQAESSAAISGATTVIDNTAANFNSWPTITLEMAGAGSPVWQIDRVGDSRTPLTVNLSQLVDGDTLVIDMDRRTIKVNGLDRIDLYVSGGWFDLSPGSITITTNDLTNVICAIAWRPAFSL